MLVALVRGATRRRRRAALPRRVARVAVANNLTAILDEVVRAMQRPGLRGAAIFLINERNELYFAAHRGVADDRVRDIRLPVGHGVVGSVAATGHPSIVSDLDAPPPGVVPTNRSTGSNALSRSMIAVPILVQDNPLGVLQMGCSEVDGFDESDVTTLQQVCAVIAPVIARANPLKLADEVLRRRVRELSALQEAAEVLNASLGLDVVLAAVAERAATLLRSGWAAVHQVSDGDVHNVGTWRHSEQTDAAAVEAAIATAAGELAPGDIHTRSLPAPPGEQPPVTDPAAPLRSLAMVRLPDADGFDAVLSVATPDPRGFDPAQQRLLAGIAHLAALAVANAVRYRQLAEAAATDALTGVLRRSEFERHLAATAGQTVSVLALDVDHLREVNDSAGHEAGDRALRAIADALRAALGTGMLARTAGDEFGVILPGADAADAIVVAEDLRRAVHSAAVMVPWLPRASIGLATAPADADPRSAWDAALEALALAKRWGRDRVETRRVAGAPAFARQTWAAMVPQLLAPGRVESVYQPIMRLHDHATVGYEAFARPAGYPAATDVEGLFAAARSAGLHRDLDWACRRAALQGGGLAFSAEAPLFVNTSIWAIVDPLHDVEQMLLVLDRAGLPPSAVILELSERESVYDLDGLRTAMAAYRAAGFRFAIDDVGEGHSTLDKLAAGSPEFIKVARSLVAGADHPGARAAVNAVVAFARSSGAAVIAEGIETAEEAERVATMGVELGQGFWLGLPASALHSAALAG